MSSEPSVSFRELLTYTDYLANRWMNYFQKHPKALNVKVGGRTGTIRNLVNHIFQVEQFFASRLLQKDFAFSEMKSPTVEDLFKLHHHAHAELSQYVASASDDDLKRTQNIGIATASSRKILTQVVLHSVHHWAQVAMEVRQAKFPAEKPQDIIMTDLMV